jgi:hypothetical protein
LLKQRFNKLAGISVYYDNAILNKHISFNNENILGIIIYDLDSKGIMKHRFFYKKNSNNYEEKLSLLENMMSTTNQEFIVYKFFPEIYKNKTIGISTLRDINLDVNKILEQKNEFDLYRVVETFKSIKIENNNVYRSLTEQEAIFRGSACENCAETGNGSCDSNLYCNPDEKRCSDKDNELSVAERSILSPTVANNLFNLDLHRRLRDNLMVNYNIGEKYIEYYYAISGFLLKEDYQTTTLLKLISTLPDFNSAVEKLIDQTNNGTEIIITENLKNDLFIIIDDLQIISNNSDYQTILNELKSDLTFLQNKTKDQILNELN